MQHDDSTQSSPSRSISEPSEDVKLIVNIAFSKKKSFHYPYLDNMRAKKYRLEKPLSPFPAHVTVASAIVPQHKVQEAAAIVKGIATHTWHFEFEYDDPVASERNIWLPVLSEELVDVRADLKERLHDSGIEASARGEYPHLTLGYRIPRLQIHRVLNDVYREMSIYQGYHFLRSRADGLELWMSRNDGERDFVGKYYFRSPRSHRHRR